MNPYGDMSDIVDKYRDLNKIKIEVKKPECEICGAELNSHNGGTICFPCDNKLLRKGLRRGK